MKILAFAVLFAAVPALAQSEREAERSESRAAMARAIDAEPEEPADAAEPADEKWTPLRIYRISATSKGQRGATGKLPQIARTLQGIGAQCVDLSSLGLAAGGSPYVESETYGVLMHGRLKAADREALAQAVCPGRSCEVKFKAVRVKARSTALLASSYGKQQPKSQLLALIKKPFPRFSQSCLDGSNGAWNATADTPEAKEWLKDAGIMFEKTRTLSLVAKTKSGGTTYLWNFGIVKNACSGDPGCDGN